MRTISKRTQYGIKAVLNLAQQMDYKEHSMYAVIEQMKSIVQAVKKFGRL